MLIIATKAYAGKSDISRTLCQNTLEDLINHASVEDGITVRHPTYGECYIGSWILGLGFYNVYFPLETSRPCTADEEGYLRYQQEHNRIQIVGI